MSAHGHLFTFRRADKLCRFHRIVLRQTDRERRSIQWLGGPQRRGGLVDDLVSSDFSEQNSGWKICTTPPPPPPPRRRRHVIATITRAAARSAEPRPRARAGVQVHVRRRLDVQWR